MGWLRGQHPQGDKTTTLLRRYGQIGGDEVHKVDRVLDVRQGELVWVAGTVYMEMPLKPNILDDISKHVSLVEITYHEAYVDFFDSTGLPHRRPD